MRAGKEVKNFSFPQRESSAHDERAVSPAFTLAASKPSAYLGATVGGGASGATSQLTNKGFEVRRLKMKQIIIRRFVILCVAFAVVFSSALVFAKSKQEPPPNAKARVGTLYLFQKSQADGPWPVVHDGAWGDMKYNLWGDKFNFIFKGRQLNPGTAYTLIYYPDPWPGTNLICLGAGVANRGGNLSIFDFGFDIKTSLPAEYDANYTPISPSGAVGAKIWLVRSSDVNCQDRQMIGWTPDQYLFEYNLINFELLQ